jgi:electron transfer flavoprotein alpha subunit
VRVGVLIKQVPDVESLALGSDGRLVRSGRALEINAYCRRAISQGVDLARQSGGSCIVFTLGPPSADDALREAVAWGADEGIHLTDPAFAGSDTLATARALAAALRLCGPFDVILAGRNSVDADTGQVGAEVAELLGLPLLAGVKAMTVKAGTVVARLELDDGWADAEIELPAVLTCAERLCAPAKVDPPGRAAVDPARLRRLGAQDLGPGPWGAAGSPTAVGEVRALEVTRRRVVLHGSPLEQVDEAVRLLVDAGALGEGRDGGAVAPGAVADGWPRGSRQVAVLVEAGHEHLNRQLLGAAARLAQSLQAQVTAIGAVGAVAAEMVGAWGADQLVTVDGSGAWIGEEDLASAVAAWARDAEPWAMLAPSTLWGREVAARVAARLGLGLTGDAIDVAVAGDRLLSWKPAFGGQLVAAVTTTSTIQMATVRPGVLPTLAPRAPRAVPVIAALAHPSGRVRILASGRDDDLDVLATAEIVVGVGAGVDPKEYPLLDPLLSALGAPLASTRKVTDQGWLPRSRQLGLTGRSIAPRLYVAIGLSGKFNHLVGVRSAGHILAVNADPAAKVFAAADVGIVGDWHEVVPRLAQRIAYPTRE